VSDFIAKLCTFIQHRAITSQEAAKAGRAEFFFSEPCFSQTAAVTAACV
jgi:hypothetical protein